MNGLLVNGLHLVGAGLGFFLIDRAARTAALQQVFWPLVFALCAVAAAALFWVTEPASMFEDFRRAYWEAGEAVWHGTADFAKVYARGVDGYVNLPIVAYLFAPFGLLSPKWASIAFFAFGGVAVLIAWRLLARMFELSQRDSALCLFALAVFGPLLYSFREGNITHVMLPLLLWALLLLRQGNEMQAGGLIALAALLKPPMALIGLYFFLRGRWGVVAGGAATGAALLLLSLALFGIDLHLLWYRACIAPFAAGPVPAFNVQSVAAFIARDELGHWSYLDWNAHALSGKARAASLIASLGLLGAALFAMLGRGWRAPKEMATIELEVWIVIGLACVLSTLSWSHYYVWLFPAFVLAYRTLRADAGKWRGILFGSFVLVAPVEFYSAQMRAGAYGPLSNILTSHELIGGILLLAVLLLIRRGAAQATSASPPG